ncbi:MAG: sortase B protein-sorting domain-containing protein [Lachnospiraceae bacterium]|nr:sortase B protein-sorting domain-containing protein [Lachnospiraceae bacterium]
MKKREIFKRGMAYLLTAAMVMGLMVCTPSDMMSVKAADGTTTSTTTGKTIAGFGTDVIADPTAPTSASDAWTGSYVYFGTYNGSPVKYRVLDSETSVFGGTTMLLDCDNILWARTNNDGQSSAFDADSNVWADSDIRSYLNATFLTNNFSTAEQNAIASSTKNVTDNSDGGGWSYLNYAELNNDKIFFLDAKEATNESYGYSNTDSVATNRVKTGGNATWWLRSAFTINAQIAGVVNSVGYILNIIVSYDDVGVSPALNVNLSSVLFSSVISGTAGQTGAEYKLTLIDSDMTIAGNGTVTRNGDTVTIPYTISGTNSANVTQVSVLLLDKEYTEGNTNDAEVLYYGALDTSTNDGTGTFTLPSDLSNKVCGRDYYAYIIAEDVNGTYETDYASAPVEITDIYDEISSVSVGVDTPVAGTALDTSVATSDAGFSVTTVAWKDGNNTTTGNADYNTAYTVNVTLTADSGYIFADNVTATVNNHTATVTGNDDGTITVSYTFEKNTHTATGYEGAYDGQVHGITVEVTDPTDTNVTYSTDGTTYSATNPAFTDVGTYTVYYKVTKDRYTTVTGEAIVTITKKALSVTADDQTIIVGESIDNSEYTVSGLISGDTLSSVTLTPSATEVTDNGIIEVSGAKIVNADGKDVTDNYNITYVAGKLVVNEVEEEQNPDTGDNSSIGLWLVLLIGSGLTAVGLWKKKKYIVEE